MTEEQSLKLENNIEDVPEQLRSLEFAEEEVEPKVGRSTQERKERLFIPDYLTYSLD